MVAKNGTKMYCPNCDKITQCKSVVPAEFEAMSWNERNPRRYYTQHPEINFYKRGRQCLPCGHKFVTGEVHEKYLSELIELRDKTKSQAESIEDWQNCTSSLTTQISSLETEIADLKLPKNSVEQSLSRQVSQLQQTNYLLIAKNEQLEATVQALEAKLAAIMEIAQS